MLNSLSIKNYALIDDISLSLDHNLTIITGETGAGKSILLGALSLLLGKRADLDSIKNPDKKCVIEGVFSIEAYHLQSIFEKNNLDYEMQTIIRREILPSGRSRAFVNDTPVRLQQLQILGDNLVDIHSQHDTLFVGNPNFQYRVIDALADNRKLLIDFQEAHRVYKNLQHKLEEIRSRQQEEQKTYDYHLFLLNELRESQLKAGIQENLEERFEQLSNVEEVKEKLSTAWQQLQQEDIGIVDALQKLKNQLSTLDNYGQSFENLSERMKSVLLEVEDMSVEIEGLLDNVEDDPEALQTVNEKLQNLYKLQKKHTVSTVDELLEIQTDLAQKISTLENAEEANSQLEEEIKSAKLKAQKLADILTRNRKKVSPKFAKSVEDILKKLGMADAQLKIELQKKNEFNLHGCDEMNWKFSANKGARLQEMKKSASGGELSRITLAIKSILAQYSKLPTIIFDEIDTGVSGDIAQKMGDIMSKMGEDLQVVSITHLPQIAAKGNQHFKVFKEIKNDKTRTIIKKLSSEERITELAEMLGGKERTKSAIAHAKVLLTDVKSRN